MPCLVERLSPSDAVGDDPHEPVDSAASASPGLSGSQRRGRPGVSAVEGPRVASTLALACDQARVFPDLLREMTTRWRVRDRGPLSDLRSSSVVFRHGPSMSRMVC
jgi:hypothetical protein